MNDHSVAQHTSGQLAETHRVAEVDYHPACHGCPVVMTFACVPTLCTRTRTA